MRVVLKNKRHSGIAAPARIGYSAAMQKLSAHAPGRVELLGNHTDYNEGFILSAAINFGVTITGERLVEKKIALHSATLNRTCVVNLDGLARQPVERWADYILGVVDGLQHAGFEVGGFSAEITSDLPLGAGLSSSAALEVATATFLKKLFNFEIEPLAIAKLCRKAENEFVGVNCGLLDQASSALGKKGHVIFLDCRTEAVETVPFPSGFSLLITHSGVKHTLVGGEYNALRAQCFDAAARLGAAALRDVSSAQLERAKSDLPPLDYARALHIVGENERVLRGLDFLRAGDAEAFGELMFASHESSRRNFENSTPELDALVEIACGEEGVLGSRLTGGGFGGATVSLIEHERADCISGGIIRKYRERTGHKCDVYLCEISDGAH